VPGSRNRPVALRFGGIGAGLLIASAIAGCGAVKQIVRPGQSVQIVITEYRLRPNSVTVTGTSRLTIDAHNDGLLTHDLAISPATGDTARTLAQTPPLAAGRSAEITVSLPPGRYTIASRILSDADLGAVGTLTVRR
jgi:uncharacterized cupredoxin-like copper-binding protein